MWVSMKQEDIEPFLHKQIKLVQNNGFILNGTIEKITDDCVLFETKQATSLININAIECIVERREQ